MLSFRAPRVRSRTPSRVIRDHHVGHEVLGCIVVRRITDDAGRAWRVREFASHAGVGLFFRCEIPGVRAETRAAPGTLESMDEERLVDLLQTGVE
jgi:hypothetical protein